MLTPQLNTNNSSHRKTKMKSLICSVLLPERLTEFLLHCPFGILLEDFSGVLSAGSSHPYFGYLRVLLLRLPFGISC